MSSTTSKSQGISNEFVSSLSAICYETSYLLARTAATKVVLRQKRCSRNHQTTRTHTPKGKQASPTHSFVVEVSQHCSEAGEPREDPRPSRASSPPTIATRPEEIASPSETPEAFLQSRVPQTAAATQSKTTPPLSTTSDATRSSPTAPAVTK